MEKIIDKIARIARQNIDVFEDAGYGMYNLCIGIDNTLSFDNSQGVIMQIYPFNEEVSVFILNYHNDDHDDIAWHDLEDTDKQTIYQMLLNTLGIEEEKSYKDKVFDLICSNAEKLKWVRDESSSYSDYECEIEENGLTLRAVSNREGEYIQILRSCTDYRIYDAKDYPKVIDILQVAHKQWNDKRDEEFFKGVYKRLSKAL